MRYIIGFTVLALGLALVYGASLETKESHVEADIIDSLAKAIKADNSAENLGLLQDILEFLKNIAIKAPAACIKKIIENCPFNAKFFKCAVDYIVENRAMCFIPEEESRLVFKKW